MKSGSPDTVATPIDPPEKHHFPGAVVHKGILKQVRNVSVCKLAIETEKVKKQNERNECIGKLFCIDGAYGHIMHECTTSYNIVSKSDEY